MKDDYATNSHYLTYTVSVWKVGRMYFLNLGVKGSESPARPSCLSIGWLKLYTGVAFQSQAWKYILPIKP